MRGCIYAILAGGGGAGRTRATAQPFLTDGGPYTGADIEMGPDGNLYYLSLYGDEALHRISYEPAQPTAKLSADKEWGDLPLKVTFDAGGSLDPIGGGLTYAWDLDGNGSFETSGGVTRSRTYENASNRTISVRVTTAADVSSTASITIYPGDSPPAVSIDSPARGADLGGRPADLLQRLGESELRQRRVDPGARGSPGGPRSSTAPKARTTATRTRCPTSTKPPAESSPRPTTTCPRACGSN